MQLGENEDEAKVLRAHAIPQGLCENLINALKLLANQQKDGDSPIQKHYYGAGRELQGTCYEWAEKHYHRTITVQWRWATCVEVRGPSKSK